MSHRTHQTANLCEFGTWTCCERRLVVSVVAPGKPGCEALNHRARRESRPKKAAMLHLACDSEHQVCQNFSFCSPLKPYLFPFPSSFSSSSNETFDDEIFLSFYLPPRPWECRRDALSPLLTASYPTSKDLPVLELDAPPWPWPHRRSAFGHELLFLHLRHLHQRAFLSVNWEPD